MTGFLDHLAGIALGNPAPSAARLSLPPRFLPSPAGTRVSHRRPAAPEYEPGALLQSTVAPPRHSPAQDEQRVGHQAGSTLPQSVEREAARVPGASATSLLRRAPSGDSAGPGPASTEAAAVLVTSTSRPATPAPRMFTPTAPDIPTAPRRPAATLTSLEPSPPPGPTVRPVLPTAPAPAHRTLTAPLSDGAVASRVSLPRGDDRPVIHVTIDRIEVRAPSASNPAPAPARVRREPTVSLAEYLRRNASGGRA
jgi:hypothetical protein